MGDALPILEATSFNFENEFRSPLAMSLIVRLVDVDRRRAVDFSGTVRERPLFPELLLDNGGLSSTILPDILINRCK